MRTSATRHRPLAAWLALAISLVVVACGTAAAPPASPASALPTEVPGDVGGEANPSAAAATPRLPSLVPATPTPSPAAPTPQPDPFALNLYRQGDFVGQYTFEWCVGASVQMTLNILRTEDDRTQATQQRLGDPAATDAFEVTGVHVLDPLYPHGSSVWGPSPEPNSLLTPEQLGTQFVARTSGRIDLGVPPGYLLILPVG